jgi:alanine racemase
MMKDVPSPLRLMLDGDALVANWRWLAEKSGSAACGAAVKADGYGLGARGVVDRLIGAGCRDLFVSTWKEAAELGNLAEGVGLSILHGVRPEDMKVAIGSSARPVLNTRSQVLQWRETGLPCDVMIDTGMNRLGMSEQEVSEGLLAGLRIDTLMSHFACADENSSMNEAQLTRFIALSARVDAQRLSIANSAGIMLGSSASLGLTRPGLAVYGGIPRGEAAGHIARVVYPQAQIVQRRRVGAGESIGYGATFVTKVDTELAILNVGYADGYLRSFGTSGTANNGLFAVIGRVSMDLLALCVDAGPSVAEGDWISIDFDLPSASAASGLSQYELLTGLGTRYERFWF